MKVAILPPVEKPMPKDHFPRLMIGKESENLYLILGRTPSGGLTGVVLKRGVDLSAGDLSRDLDPSSLKDFNQTVVLSND